MRDEFLLNILCTLIETSYECVPLSSKKYPKKVGKSLQLIPKWDYVIKPLKEDLLFWHSVWLSAGRPSQGVLHQFLCSVRAKYHKAVKCAKRQVSRQKYDDLLHAAELGNVEMVKELQKSFGKKKPNQHIPECLEGKVNPGEILEQFRERYKELYNSICTVEEMNFIKSQIKDLLHSEPVEEASKITPSVVK